METDELTLKAEEEAIYEKLCGLREQANNLFKDDKFQNATDVYGHAIDILHQHFTERREPTWLSDAKEEKSAAGEDEVPSPVKEIPGYLASLVELYQIFLSNRSQSHMKLENWMLALEDCDQCILISRGTFKKGFFRRVLALQGMGSLEKARSACFEMCTKWPQDPLLRETLSNLTAAVQKTKNENLRKAIEKTSEGVPSKPSSANYKDIEVPSSYQGPSYVEGQITEEFVTSLLRWQQQEQLLHIKYVYQICHEVKPLLRKMPNVVPIPMEPNGKMTVCGDIHGQYYDLLHIWELNGRPSPTNPYLFNGDFVDRGSFSIECILALFAHKILYPNAMFLARGNHESRNMNMLYGFQGECNHKYSNSPLYELFCECFCLLPLAHVIRDSIFVCHGGLFSEDDVTIAKLNAFNRDQEPPDSGLMTEILWSDPTSTTCGRAQSKRGVGIAFGQNVTENFLETNCLDMVIRSHEMQEEGYSLDHDGKLATVFSAPNYCDTMDNRGAYITFCNSDPSKRLTPEFHRFEEVPHPTVRALHFANLGMQGFL